MTETDPLATERFRTILTDAILSTGYTAAGMGIDADPEIAAGKTLAYLPLAHFERTVNEHGVPVRRIAVRTGWEVDPEPPAGGADPMYVTLSWVYHQTWPEVRGSIVNRLAEAAESADRGSQGSRGRLAVPKGHGRTTRHTVHRIEWPPLYDTDKAGDDA